MPIIKSWKNIDIFHDIHSQEAEAKYYDSMKSLSDHQLLAQIATRQQEILVQANIIGFICNAIVDILQGIQGDHYSHYNESLLGELRKISSDLDTLCRAQGKNPGWFGEE